MWMNHTPVDPSKGKPDYHLTTDMADKAIEWVTAMRSNAPGRPWAMYWATGANHAPHQSPKAWRDKYKGRFDMGYDKAREMVLANQKKLGIVPPDTVLTARPQDIPAWDSLSAEQKKLYARQMEAFAAQLSHADYEFGRIIDALDRTGQLENTIVIVFPDNGASAEGDRGGTYNEFRFANGVPTSDAQNMKYYDSWGGPATFNHYAAGWAMAGNTPFRYSKQMVHPGGTRDPLVISWPKGIKDKGGIRTQFTHVIDIGPTVLAAAGVAQPTEVNGIKQIPYDGAAFNATFDDPQAKTRSTQYFEMYGNRSLYKDGWLAVTLHAQRQPWDLAKRAPFEDDVWELYNLNEDFSGARDVAALYPDKLKELQQVWERRGAQVQCLPAL
jgi:arylsulfatase